MTDLLYLRDADLRRFQADVIDVDSDSNRVQLSATAFYVHGGGQPADSGVLRWDGGSATVTDVRKVGGLVWHRLEGEPPAPGQTVTGEIDWDRRYDLMRTHSAMHVLCGVVYQKYGVLSTGNNMEPLRARMDLDFDPLPDRFAEELEAAVNAEIAADRPIEVSFLPRAVALADEDLIRTKVNLIPETVAEIRVIDIVGLDKQADGGTHVHRTSEIGRFSVTKTESKGKGNKRVRFELG